LFSAAIYELEQPLSGMSILIFPHVIASTSPDSQDVCKKKMDQPRFIGAKEPQATVAISTLTIRKIVYFLARPPSCFCKKTEGRGNLYLTVPPGKVTSHHRRTQPQQQRARTFGDKRVKNLVAQGLL
jgi:hypothetical protein